MYIAAVSDATFENIDVEGFASGVAVNDWVRGMTFRDGRIANNRKNIDIGGATEAPVDVVFERNREQ